jgi:pyruvate formate lyase activating enzyme
MHDALLQTAEGERVRCGLCPHECLIAEDGHGICGVRGVVDGRLKALTYGLVSSIAADPIEKKPVFHFHPGSTALSFGSIGCNMRCGHCQNWQISRLKEDDGTIELTMVEPEAVVDLAQRTGSTGVAFTYNEPVISIEWVLDVARVAKREGLYTVMVTNGYVKHEGLDLFAEFIDVWRVDIKGYTEETYRRLCHVAHPEVVREQAARARQVHGLHVECVTNVVPTVNDSEAELRDIARWIASTLGAETPWHVTRFVPYLEFANLPATPVATLERARAIGREEGLDFIFLGNVSVPGGEDTVCPRCGTVVVERHGFGVSSVRLDAGGRCASCGAELGIVLAGVRP